MTLNASSAQVADPPAILFDRTAITRSAPLVDANIAYLIAFAAGDAAGFSRGFSLASFTAAREGFDDGAVAGHAAGVGAGIAAATCRAYDEGSEDAEAEASAIGFATGFATGEAAAGADTAETDPPEIGTLVPTPGVEPGGAGGFPATYAAARAVPIRIPVADDLSDIAFVAISLRYPGSSEAWQTVYAGAPGAEGAAGYLDGWGGSALTGDGSPTVGFTFDVLPDVGWPAAAAAYSVEVVTRAVDSKGNVL